MSQQTLHIDPQALKIMVQDAEQSHPNECCGFFYGDENDEHRFIQHSVVVENSKEGDQRRRFQISPLDYMKAERYADEKGLKLLGVYHSHPEHPAIPSEHDRVQAVPYFSYIILSVYGGKLKDTRSYRLNEKQAFDEEKIENLKVTNL